MGGVISADEGLQEFLFVDTAISVNAASTEQAGAFLPLSGAPPIADRNEMLIFSAVGYTFGAADARVTASQGQVRFIDQAFATKIALPIFASVVRDEVVGSLSGTGATIVGVPVQGPVLLLINASFTNSDAALTSTVSIRFFAAFSRKRIVPSLVEAQRYQDAGAFR
jgi:hypothetical protein